MGWDYTRREKGQSHLDFFRKEIDCETHKLLSVAGTMLGPVYGALEITHPGQEPFVIGVVFLVHWDHSNLAYNFGYKEISEEMGPCEASCPRKILDRLTSLSVLEERGIFSGKSLEFASAWRDRCEQNLEKREALRLKQGMILRTPKIIKFGRDGRITGDTFLCTNPKRLHFRVVWRNEFSSEVRFTDRAPLLDAEHIADAWPR